jgi:hypothetical protein
VFASEISHSVLRQQNADWADGQTEAKTCKQPTKAYIWLCFFRGCTRRCRSNHSGIAEAAVV